MGSWDRFIEELSVQGIQGRPFVSIRTGDLAVVSRRTHGTDTLLCFDDIWKATAQELGPQDLFIELHVMGDKHLCKFDLFF